MEKRKQLGRRITREVIDNNTGEVLVSEDLVVKVGDIDKFIMFISITLLVLRLRYFLCYGRNLLISRGMKGI